MNSMSIKQKTLEMVNQTYADLLEFAGGLSPQEKNAKSSLKLRNLPQTGIPSQ